MDRRQLKSSNIQTANVYRKLVERIKIIKKRRKRFKLYAMLIALFLMISSETQCVFAEENEVQESLPADDMELNIPENAEVVSEKGLTAEELDVTINGEETIIYGSEDQIAVMSDDTGSTQYTGTVSGCLAQTNDYALYAAELPAGSYLQARLTLPNSDEIDYDLVLYDSALSVIKACDYLTYMNGTGPLAESIGYQAATDEKVYIGVYSTYGGHDTEEYTLEFSITTDYSENGEPNENAKEAIALTLENSGISVSGALNSAIDNDWYSFTVLDSPSYDKIRLDMDFTSSTNDYNIEIYKNLASDYYAMQLVAQGKKGEIALPAGTYFLRIVTTNSLSDFNAGEYPIYELSVTPVSRFNKIEITKFSGYNGDTIPYPFGSYYRIDENENGSNWITIRGWVYYKDSIGNNYAAANVKINATVINRQWEAKNRPELAVTYGSAVTGSNGFFAMNVYLNSACGTLVYDNIISKHYYDIMEVRVNSPSNSDIFDINYFYYLKDVVPY